MKVTGTTEERTRNQLTTKRNQLLKKFFKNPSETRLAIEIRVIVDEIAKLTEHLMKRKVLERALGASDERPTSEVGSKSQDTLIEEAKLAPRYSPALALLYYMEPHKGKANRAVPAVRKLVEHLTAVNCGQCSFSVLENEALTASGVLPLSQLGERAQTLRAPVD